MILVIVLTLIAIAEHRAYLNRTQTVSQIEAKRPSYTTRDIHVQKADGSKVWFTVEVATSPMQHAYGLMFKKHIVRKTGMLFLFDVVEPVSFWMKNTFLPLDMLFIDEKGGIRKIVVNARPLDETLINSDVPVKAVLEINGGESQSLGIKAGDVVLDLIESQGKTP